MIIGTEDVTSYNGKEIRAISGREVIMPITLAATNAPLEKGTVLGLVTATGCFAPYKSGNVDGTGVARAILAEFVPAASTTQISTAYIKIIAKKDALIGLDSSAMTDLGAREPAPNIVII